MAGIAPIRPDGARSDPMARDPTRWRAIRPDALYGRSALRPYD
jgi:hypothetical protein